MGKGIIITLLAAASLAPLAASQAPQPAGQKLSLFDLLSGARDKAALMLASPRAVDKLADDAALFTPRFRQSASARGLAWPGFVALGKPVAPASFGGGCNVDSTDYFLKRFNNFAAGRNSACPIPATCTVYSARETGCYKINLDVCIEASGETRIDAITNLMRFTKLDFKTPADVTPCTREADRLGVKRAH